MYRCTECARVFGGRGSGTNRSPRTCDHIRLAARFATATHGSSSCSSKVDSLHAHLSTNIRLVFSRGDSPRRSFARSRAGPHPAPPPADQINPRATRRSSPSTKSRAPINRRSTTSSVHCVPTGCVPRRPRYAPISSQESACISIHSALATSTRCERCRAPRPRRCTSTVRAKHSRDSDSGTSTA